MSKKKKNKKFKNKFKNATLVSSGYNKPETPTTQLEEAKEALAQSLEALEEEVKESVFSEDDVVEVLEEENDEFFEDRLNPMFADIKREDDPGYFDETIEFTALPEGDQPQEIVEEVTIEEPEENLIFNAPTTEEETPEITIEQIFEEAKPMEEDPEIEIELYEKPVEEEEPYKDPEVEFIEAKETILEPLEVEDALPKEQEQVMEEDIDRLTEKLEELGQAVWIHDKIPNESFIRGYMILKSCTCGICGYHANVEKDVCPNCNTVMNR